MNIYNLIKTQLLLLGLDGLYNIKSECVCRIGNNFIPCNEPLIDCYGGINIPLTNDGVDFTISSINKALKNWPKCPECLGSGTNQQDKTPDIPCVKCIKTGYFIRNNNDYDKITTLLRKDLCKS